MPASEPSREPVRDAIAVCPGCGRIAPLQRDTCAVCDAELDEAHEVPDRKDRAYAVAVRCQFQCRQCGKLAPLNHLDVDGSVVCVHCELDQAFDVDVWKAGLRHAHGVGDLAGPALEGRHPHERFSIVGANPGASIGTTETTSTLTENSKRNVDGIELMRSLRIEASPGHPLCPACHVPLDVTLDEETTVTICKHCGDTATYQMPEAAAELHKALVAVQAEDHRRDHLDARIDVRAGGGTVAVACPGCGANMPVHGETKVVVCQFCQTVSRIPDQVRQQTFHITPETETWWLWFKGGSDYRRRVERGEETRGLRGYGKFKEQVIEKAPTVPTPWLPRWLIGAILVGGILLVTLVALLATGMFETIAQGFLIIQP
jgi:RNase P subunit RPR2